MNNKEIRILELLKRLRDSRMPRFGGHEYKGAGVGMGRFLLGLTAHGFKKNGKVVISNGAY